MKKLIAIVLTVMLLTTGLGVSAAFADAGACTDTPNYPQVKVAQVPIPWQFWAIEDGTVIDLIRISPTWLEPPDGQPAGDGGVWVRRWWTTVDNPLLLTELVWSPGVIPSPTWESDPEPIMIEDGDPATPPTDLLLEIPVVPLDSAVLVAYEVYKESEIVPGEPAAEPEAHFINEAILESQSPQAIVQVLINFDVHNNTCRNDITNFELDFFGLDFSCVDIVDALGFIVPDPTQLWGANATYPLVVRPIEGGTEVKWVQPDRPLANCEWLHVGLVFNVDPPGLASPGFIDATVQGYWTILRGSPGYWKNHPEAWPVDEITIGGQTYTKAEAIAIMQAKPKKGDKTYTMFSALVAAKLNMQLANAPGCTIGPIIDAADAWMTTYPVESGVRGKDDAWQVDGEALYEILDEYNNGKPCPPCDD